MSSHRDDQMDEPSDAPVDGHSQPSDLGTPIQEIAELQLMTSPGFRDRVRRRINRRIVASQVLHVPLRSLASTFQLYTSLIVKAVDAICHKGTEAQYRNDPELKPPPPPHNRE